VLIFLVIINEIVHRIYFSLHIITLYIAGLMLQESKALDSFREWGGLTFFRRQYLKIFTDTAKKSNGPKEGEAINKEIFKA